MRRAAILLSVLAAACARTHLETEGETFFVDGEPPGEGPAQGSGAGGANGGLGASQEDPSANAPLQSGSAEGTAGSTSAPTSTMPPMQNAGSAGAAQSEPMSGTSGTEVWIGQLWSISLLLCDPNAPPEDTPLVVQPMGYTERVVLILERSIDATSPSGVIAFGEGELPTVPEKFPDNWADGGSFWACSNRLPSRGGEYTVLDARRWPERLSFEFVPGEIWNGACREGDPCCKTGTQPLCTVPIGQRVALDFLVTGDEMQTTFLAAAFGTAGELRLRRVQ